MRALIVDDEPLAREGIRGLLAGDPEVTAIGEARNGREAVAALRERAWDFVFLDVQMPELDGFGVVEAIGAERMPAIVFVTAHDRFAIRAFEINAIDYLQKPVTRERFARALARVKARRSAPSTAAILGLLEAVAVTRRGIERLAVRSAGKTEFVEIEDIDWIEAAENYVQLHVGKATHLLHVTMAALENTLDPNAFVRVHRSIIVRIDRIKAMAPSNHGEYMLTLTTGLTLRTGRSYAERLRALATNPF